MPKPETIRVEPMGEDVRVEVAPGVKIIDAPPVVIQRVGVFDWQPAGDGTFRPIVRIHDTMIRVTEAVRITGVSYLTFRRLIRAGYVKAVMIAPQTLLMDLNSYHEHVETCRNDPEFWTLARRKEYEITV